MTAAKRSEIIVVGLAAILGIAWACISHSAYSKDMGTLAVWFGENTCQGVVGQRFIVSNRGLAPVIVEVTDEDGILPLFETPHVLDPSRTEDYYTNTWEPGSYTILFESTKDGRTRTVTLHLGMGPVPEGDAPIGTFSVCFTDMCIGGKPGDWFSIVNQCGIAVRACVVACPEGAQALGAVFHNWPKELSTTAPKKIISTLGYPTGGYLLRFSANGYADIETYVILGSASPAVRADLMKAQVGSFGTGGPIIVGDSGAAIPGATVKVSNAAGKSIHVTAAEDGSFRITLMQMSDAEFEMAVGDTIDVVQRVGSLPDSKKVTLKAEF